MADSLPAQIPLALGSTASVGPPAVSSSGASGSLTGRQLGHFRVEARIAEGGMGEVYLGFDLSLSRPVAIKVIRPDLARDPRFLNVFLREAQAQANVVHSHVLQAYYVGEAEGTWFLAMQVVDGGSLEDLLVEGKRLSWKDAARHMTAVVAGMAEAARLGIVHRDIKPANILLDRFGDAHVADFGLATSTGLLQTHVGEGAHGPNTHKPGSTQAGAVMGTPEYMPPEQLAGKPLDERADIYAIGVTFYQLISGQLPYRIHDLPSAQAAVTGSLAKPLRALRPDVPRAFANVIDRCFARSPDDRPSTHAELLAILKKVGPRPEVTPSPLVRALSWAVDLAPFALVLPLTYQKAPGLAFAVLALWLGWGLFALSATPGQWMMRLWLRSGNGGDVPLGRLFLRSLLQLGWLLPGSLFLTLAYSGSRAADPLGLLALAWGVTVLIGSGLAMGSRRQALHDRLTGVRVLVATG